MSSSLESHYLSIIRLLDVQVIGPYLVKRGVLSSQEYYDNYVGPLQKGETSYYKLSLKLATECLRKPNDFLEALEESLYDNGSHASHQELFEMMPYAANGKKKSFVHRATHKVIKRVFSKKQKTKAPAIDGHISVDSDSDGHLANGYDSTDGYSSSDDDDEASVDVDRSKITGLSKKGWSSNASSSSLNIPRVFTAEKGNFRGSTGSLNIPGYQERNRKNSVGHIKCTFNGTERSLQTSSPTKHQRTSAPIIQNVTAKTNQKDKDEEDIKALYKQSKLEVTKLKEKNRLQEETMKKCQSECEELRKQIKELQQLKGRDGHEVLKETMEKMKNENKRSNEQVTQLKTEITTLSEKLASRPLNEEHSRTTKAEQEKNMQSLQTKIDSITIQLESTKVKLESKQEMVEHLEAGKKELTKQLNELKLTKQMTLEQAKYQKEIVKYREKCEMLECQVQEKDVKISNLEGKMEVTALDLQQIQNLLTTISQREATKDIVVTVTEQPQKKPSDHGNDSFAECSKQDLIEIIETHVDQIEALHQKLYRYKKEIKRLRRKIQLVI